MDRWLRLLTPITLLPLVVFSIISGCSTSAAKIELTTVPAVAGQSSDAALALIQDVGLSIGEQNLAYSDTVPSGMVISTTPAGGEELETGSSLDIVISLGPEMVSLPALLGTVEAEAAASLQALGLLAEIRRIYNEKVHAGLVCDMEPDPNSSVPRSSKVVLIVSQGSAYITCTTCGGQGTVTTSETCPECGGTGTCFT